MRKIVSILLALLVLLPISVSAGTLESEGVSVGLDIPNEIDTGQNFTANVEVSVVTNLDSFQFDIVYNSMAVEVTNVLDGLIDSNPATIDMWGFIPPGRQGRVRILGNLAGVDGVTGSGYLARIELRNLMAGKICLHFGNGILVDTESSYIDVMHWNEGCLIVTGILLGDVDGDGTVDMGDVTKTERIILGVDKPVLEADSNQDGVIDMADITMTERIILYGL